MRTLGIVLLVGVVSIMVFGFMAMQGSGHQGHGMHGCIAATAAAQGTCAKVGGPLGEAEFHLSIFKNFSRSLSVSLVALAALLLVVLFSIRKDTLVGNDAGSAMVAFTVAPVTSRVRVRALRRIMQWISRHEMRDPSLLLRAHAIASF